MDSEEMTREFVETVFGGDPDAAVETIKRLYTTCPCGMAWISDPGHGEDH